MDSGGLGSLPLSSVGPPGWRGFSMPPPRGGVWEGVVGEM